MTTLKDDIPRYAERTARVLTAAGYRADFQPLLFLSRMVHHRARANWKQDDQ